MKKSNFKKRVTEDVDIKQGKYEFRSVDGYVELSYRGKVIAIGDFDENSNSYWLSHSSFKGQKSFETAEEAIDYFEKNRITTENASRKVGLLKRIIQEEVRKALTGTNRRSYPLTEGKRELNLIDQTFSEMGYGPMQIGDGAYRFWEKRLPTGIVSFGAADSSAYLDRTSENVWDFNVAFFPYKKFLGLKTGKKDIANMKWLLDDLMNSTISFDLGIGLFSQSDSVIKNTISDFIKKYERKAAK